MKLIICSILLISGIAHAKTVHYELTATKQSINLSGKRNVDFALLLNGSIPAPTLEFTEGDDAEIVVRNSISDEELSIHWHGILLPTIMDGVPYVTTPPIKSGETYTFRFKIRQNGTYWYHSHTNVQEQKGIFGAIIIHPRRETIKYDKDIAVVLSDWSDENPLQIIKNLRKDGDYYLYKKDTVRSWWGAYSQGALGNFLHNEWTRMGGMDLSDVGYDAFLINGKKDIQLASPKVGQKVRLRLINSSGSTYFYAALAGAEPLHVASVDGVDVSPIKAKEILLGMAETYDVIFTLPEKKNFELKITAQDGTGSASGWIGEGEKVFAPERTKPDLYMTMDHSAHANHGSMDHSQMHHHEGMIHDNTIATLTVDNLKALTPAKPAQNVHELKLVLDGDMARYIWYINGKTISEDRTIFVNEGDYVRIIFENATMMHHPMHLHGHFFRVLNKNELYSPLKHTVDVPPHGSRTIEFVANESGEWMLHCHNLYHMKAGMARVVKYSNFQPTPEILSIQKQDPHLHDHIYYYGMFETATNHAQMNLRASKTWDEIEARFETREDFSWKGEGDLFYKHWYGRYLNFIAGGVGFEGQYNLAMGVGYILPMLVKTKLLLLDTGKLRLDVEKKFQWTGNIFTNADVTFRDGINTEYEISLMYSPSWTWAAGIKFTEDSKGVGLQLQF